MSTSAKSPQRFTVALNLPEDQSPLYIVRARNFVERMTGNPWFPEPVPSLAEVQVAINELFEAQVAAVTRAMGTAATRNAKRLVLHGLLQRLAVYVQEIANANPEQAVAIIESAGMDVKNSRGPAPRTFHLEPTGRQGEARVVVPKAGDNASYEYQYSLDGGVTWLPFPQLTTNYTTAPLGGLKPGSMVHVRYRFTLKGVTSDWSGSMAIVVE